MSRKKAEVTLVVESPDLFGDLLDPAVDLVMATVEKLAEKSFADAFVKLFPADEILASAAAAINSGIIVELPVEAVPELEEVAAPQALSPAVSEQWAEVQFEESATPEVEAPLVVAAVAAAVIAAPPPETLEISLDALFGDEELDLIAAPEPAAPPVLEKKATTASAAAPAASVPVWKERAELLKEIGRTKGAVILQRAGSRKIAVVPCDLETAAILIGYTNFEQFEMQSDNYFEDYVSPLKNVRHSSGDGRIHFPIQSLLKNPFIEGSGLWAHLQKIGLQPFAGASLRNWVMKQVQRIARENTPFNLPVIVDSRPLFERMEVGLITTCIQDIGSFKAGEEYVVVETDVINEDAGADEETKAQKGVGLKERATSSYGKPVYWNEIDGDMGEYFTTDDASGAFDPENTFAKAHPDLYEPALARIEKQKLPVFDFIRTDVAELVNYRSVVFTDPPRMGKTSKLIQYVEASGVKNAALVTVSNGLDVFASELKRMGITDFVWVKKLADLEKPAKYYLMSYSWLKSTGRKPPKVEGFDRLPSVNNCPHCTKPMERPARSIVTDGSNRPVLVGGKPKLRFDFAVVDGKRTRLWSQDYGYMCRNPECSFSSKNQKLKRILPNGEKAKVAGPAWYGKNTTLTGYVDTALAGHALCVDRRDPTFGRGRQCATCGYVHNTWMPWRYKRLGKKFSLIGVDEVHNVKSTSSDQSKAVMGMTHARRRVSMTGTLMPNHPRDAFNPLSWTFGNNNSKFPFARGQAGVEAFNAEYTDTITVESETGSYSKAVPFIKKPRQWWEWKASKTHFRGYSDPRVIESMQKAGLVIPTFKPIPVELQPEAKQAITLVASIAQFDDVFAKYNEELKEKSKENEKVYLINSGLVLSRMNLMRYAATIPGLLNEKLAALGKPAIYDGPYGGIKMEYIKNTVKDKVTSGGKVVIFSDMRPMQALLETELAEYNAIRFSVGWGSEKRAKMFKLFREDPNFSVFICGPRAVRESIDLSSANTVISSDLLWSPGIQTQAWARVLTPRMEPREVECHIPLTKYSIDSHVYSTFYSKIAAAEQALYGRTLTKADKTFDVKYFVDQILSEKAAIVQWLIDAGEDEMSYMPIFKTLQQLTSYGEGATGND